jgi:hypothetical protein
VDQDPEGSPSAIAVAASFLDPTRDVFRTVKVVEGLRVALRSPGIARGGLVALLAANPPGSDAMRAFELLQIQDLERA